MQSHFYYVDLFCWFLVVQIIFYRMNLWYMRWMCVHSRLTSQVVWIQIYVGVILVSLKRYTFLGLFLLHICSNNYIVFANFTCATRRLHSLDYLQKKLKLKIAQIIKSIVHKTWPNCPWPNLCSTGLIMVDLKKNNILDVKETFCVNIASIEQKIPFVSKQCKEKISC